MARGRVRRRNYGRHLKVSRHAELYLTAERFTDGDEVWLDQSRNGHDATLGSTGGADTNDPTFIPWAGENYLKLPGVAANYISTPDSAATSVTGDISIRAFASLPDWTPSSAGFPCTKYVTGGNQRSWLFYVNTVGKIGLDHTTDGTSGTLDSVISSVGAGFSDGTKQWIRADLDVSTGDKLFYTGGSDPAAPVWVQLGSTISGSPTSIFDGTALLSLGAYNAGGTSPTNIDIYRMQVYEDLTETSLVFDYHPQQSFSVDQSSNAAVITTNRASSGAKSVEVTGPDFLLFTDDYFEIADAAGLDFAETDPMTIVAVVKLHGTTADQAIVAKKSNLTTAAGYLLDRGTSNAIEYTIADGTLDDLDVAASISQDAFHVIAGVRNVGRDDVEIFVDGLGTGSPTTDSTTVTLANAFALRIGRLADAGTGYLDGELVAVLIFREALSVRDLRRLNRELGVAA